MIIKNLQPKWLKKPKTKGEKLTKIMKVSIAAVIASTLLVAGANKMQRYEIKSGQIEYDISTSGNVMGMMKMEMKGTKKVTFDEYGFKHLVEEKKLVKKWPWDKLKKRIPIRYSI